jgi:serine/threonine protein kinase/tetratricopeptide (TPR) repeat protein
MADLSAPAEELLRRLPLPLAQLYRRAHNAKTARDAHDFAFYLWEAALKLLAGSAAVSYRHEQPTDPKIAAALANLARPSLGHWCEIVRRLTPVLAQRGVAGYKAVEEIVYGRPRNDLPRCAGLFSALDFALGKGGGPRPTVQVGDLLDRLVEYRNKTSGHGAPAAHTSEMLRGLADALMLAAGELFVRVDVLAGRRLMYVAEVRPVRGSWLVERVELAGVAPWRVASLEVARAEGQPPPAETGVYLADPAAPDDLAAMTRLHPYVVYEPESESVLFLNAQRSGRRVELLCYTSGRTVELTGANAAGSVRDGPDDEPAAADVDSAIGRCIGEYRLITELGRGAMGVVYRAWQPSLNREVAIKVQPRTGDAKADARFRREVRALGRVEHPNLIKVHTSGSDGDYFYYTMELVEGAPLAAVSDALTQDGRTTVVDLPVFQEKVGKAYAAAKAAEKPLTLADKADPFKRRLGEKSRDLVSLPDLLLEARQGKVPELGRDIVRQIVMLARQVAEAAHALHEAGILHRDIKPGNILVTADGNTAVLMDLGLAQLADDVEGRLTRTRQFVGTLRYASPQQVLASGPLDRRADVYSLGATLWELLALRPLFGATEITPTMALMEMIQRNDPERVGRVNRAVDQDLEAVVHKCLEKSPDGRYPSAKELADDLGRWLEGKPVKARPVRRWERAWKWSKRRPLLSGLSAALVLAVVAGTVASWLFAAKAEREAARAEREATNARTERDAADKQKRQTKEILDTVVSPAILRGLRSQPRLSKAQLAIIDRALDYYRQLAAQEADDENGRRMVAEAQFNVALRLEPLGRQKESLDTYRKALAVYQSLAADFPNESRYRHAVAACHNNLGILFFQTGRLTEADVEFRAALPTMEAMAAAKPDDPKFRHDLAVAHRNIGRVANGLGRTGPAEAEFRTSLEILEKLVAAFPKALENRTDLGLLRFNLAMVFETTGRMADAEAEHRKCLALWTEMVAADPEEPDYSRELAGAHRNIGRLLAATRRLADAETEYRAALEINENLIDEYPGVPDYRSDLCLIRNNYANLLSALGRRAEAETELRATVKLRERLAKQFPAVHDYATELGGSYLNMGNLPFAAGDAAAALPWHTKAVDRLREVLKSEPRQATAREYLEKALIGRAQDLMALKRFADAIPDIDAALSYDQGQFRVGLRFAKATCLSRLGRHAEAVLEADATAADPRLDANGMYDAACFASLASARPDHASTEAQAARAVELLRKSIAKGFADVQHLIVDTDLDPLRKRADYAALLWDLADMPAGPPQG